MGVRADHDLVEEEILVQKPDEFLDQGFLRSLLPIEREAVNHLDWLEQVGAHLLTSDRGAGVPVAAGRLNARLRLSRHLQLLNLALEIAFDPLALLVEHVLRMDDVERILLQMSRRDALLYNIFLPLLVVVVFVVDFDVVA